MSDYYRSPLCGSTLPAAASVTATSTHYSRFIINKSSSASCKTKLKRKDKVGEAAVESATYIHVY